MKQEQSDWSSPSADLITTTAIKLSRLQYAYSSSKDPVLSIAKWEVAPRQQVFLHGPSGSGKSTLLNILSGVISPRQGEVSVLGKAMHIMSASQRDSFRAEHIGFIFQQFNLIPYLSVLDNIRLASYFADTKHATLEKHIKSLTEQLRLPRKLLNQRADNLSVGQQQRVAIARALVNQPELIIADEPTSSLDTDARDDFLTLLLETSQTSRRTLIFVSHDTHLAQNFSEVVDMNQLNQARFN